MGPRGFCQAMRGLRKLRRGAERGRAAHGGGLVRSDGREGGAQNVLVVQSNGRVAKQIGVQRGGGVVASAESGLHHGHIHALFPEEQQGQHREKFKIGQATGRGSRGHDGIGVRCPGFAGQGLPVHADALFGRNKMRRGVQAGFTAVSRAERGQKGRRGTLAVSAQNLDHRERRSGQVQGGQGAAHAIQAHVHVKKAEAVQMGQYVLKIVEHGAHGRHSIRKRAACQQGRRRDHGDHIEEHPAGEKPVEQHDDDRIDEGMWLSGRG